MSCYFDSSNRYGKNACALTLNLSLTKPRTCSTEFCERDALIYYVTSGPSRLHTGTIFLKISTFPGLLRTQWHIFYLNRSSSFGVHRWHTDKHSFLYIYKILSASRQDFRTKLLVSSVSQRCTQSCAYPYRIALLVCVIQRNHMLCVGDIVLDRLWTEMQILVFKLIFK